MFQWGWHGRLVDEYPLLNPFVRCIWATSNKGSHTSMPLQLGLVPHLLSICHWQCSMEEETSSGFLGAIWSPFIFFFILIILISDHFSKYSLSFQHILISTNSKCQFSNSKLSFSYNKKLFQIFLSSQNIILISNLTISNVSIQTLILISTHSKWSTHFTHSI